MQEDKQARAYVYSTIFHNITKVSDKEPFVKFCIDSSVPESVVSLFKEYADEECNESTGDCFFVVKNKERVDDICSFFSVADTALLVANMDITEIFKKSNKECKEFIKAYFEKYGDVSYETCTCSITGYSRKHLDAIVEHLGIPCEQSKIHSLEQITFKDINVVDFLGAIYTNKLIAKVGLYDAFLKIVRDRPVLRYTRDSLAVAPTKANYSDAGFDISIVGVYKDLTSRTKLYSTGIRLDIPVGYYVEIVPRSSISRSGYMLSNSIGIIDCSYKGEVLVALTKIDDSTPEITFPYRCCQLIMKRQVFPDLVETEVLEKSKRADGCFGSSG